MFATLNPCDCSSAGFAVKLNKAGGAPFLGKAALQAQQALPVKQRVVSLTLARRSSEPTAPDTVLPYGQEPIFRNGDLVGYVSSAAFGHSVGAPVMLAMLGPIPSSEESSPERPARARDSACRAWLKGGRFEVHSSCVRQQSVFDSNCLYCIVLVIGFQLAFLYIM